MQVCDTRELTAVSDKRNNAYGIDVKVMVEVFGGGGAEEMYTLMLSNAFTYYGISYNKAPMVTGLSPHAASSGEAVTLTGLNLGFWIQDYRMTYVGTGRAPQGGNIITGNSDAQAGFPYLLFKSFHRRRQLIFIVFDFVGLMMCFNTRLWPRTSNARRKN